MRLLRLIVGILPGGLVADEPGRRAVDYTRDVKPVLSKRCYACHGALQQKAGLRLDTASLMKKGGESGSAIEPGSSDDSLIIDAVTGAQGWRMPPESEGLPLSKLRDLSHQGLDRSGGEEPCGRGSPARPQAALVVSTGRSSKGAIRGRTG